jgi:F-type H+-transporting ATPase subunit c
MDLPLAQEAVQQAYNAKFAVAFAGTGAAIGIGMIGYAAANAIGRNPGAFGKVLTISIIGMALAEAIAFYALFL